MKKLTTTTTKTITLLLAGSILFTSCASTTMIQSTPVGAKVYLNGESVGTTPYSHRDTKIVGSTTTVKLEKEGYEPFVGSFSRDEQADVGAIIGGIFFLFPFLWTMKYKPTHTFEMTSVSGNQSASAVTEQSTSTKTKSERMLELKQLLEDQAITQEEYEKEKQKVLAE